MVGWPNDVQKHYRMKVSGFCRIAWCFLRCAIAVAIVWCILVEVAEAFAGSLFGMELDGDCILIVSGSSMDECAAFARLYALPIAIAVSVLSAAFVGAVAMAAFSSRRVFMTVVGIISACICLRVVHVGSFRAWKPAYVAFDMLRSAHVYQSVGAAGRWTADRAAKVRDFGAALAEKSGLEVVYEDERLTTVEAEEMLIEAGLSRQERKKVIDKVAAEIILRCYLNK